LIFNRNGIIVGHETEEIDTLHCDTNHVEHDVEALIASIKNAIQSAISTPEIWLWNIVSIALATQRSSIVCRDRLTGEALS